MVATMSKTNHQPWWRPLVGIAVAAGIVTAAPLAFNAATGTEAATTAITGETTDLKLGDSEDDYTESTSKVTCDIGFSGTPWEKRYSCGDVDIYAISQNKIKDPELTARRLLRAGIYEDTLDYGVTSEKINGGTIYYTDLYHATNDTGNVGRTIVFVSDEDQEKLANDESVTSSVIMLLGPEDELVAKQQELIDTAQFHEPAEGDSDAEEDNGE